MHTRPPHAPLIAALVLTAGTALADPCPHGCSHADVGLGVRSLPLPIDQLPGPLQDTLARIADRAEAGDEIPLMCLEAGTDPKVADAFNAHLMQLWDAGPERYRLDDRWNNTVTNGNTGPLGTPIVLTYSFVPDGTSTPDGPSELHAWMDSIYGSIDVWQPIIHEGLNAWNTTSGVVYVWEQNDDGASFPNTSGSAGNRGDVRISAATIDGNGGVLAYNYFPDTGDMVIDAHDSFYEALNANSLRLRNVITHEAGHGIGLSHVESSNARFLMEPFIDTNFEGPQEDDTRGANRGYGDHQENDDSFGTAVDLGTLTGGDFIRSDRRSIDDNGDDDYFKFNTTGDMDLEILLRPIGSTYNEGPQGGTQSPLDSLRISNLRFSVYDASFSLIAAVDDEPEGVNESAVVPLTGTGPHYILVEGDANGTQRYRMNLTFTGVAACFSDCDANGALNVDDVDCFVAAFLGSDLAGADCDGNGSLNVDDVDCFVAEFLAGCP